MSEGGRKMLLLEMKRRLCTRYVLFSLLGVLIITIGLNLIIVSDQNGKRREAFFSIKEGSG